MLNLFQYLCLKIPNQVRDDEIRMQDPLYREIILEHWENPQNFGVLKDADIDIEEVNPLCGDVIRLTIKTEKGKVKNILFTGIGCAISKASASLFTEEIKNKRLEALKKVTEQEVLDLLEIELTPARTKCALLVFKTLKKGLELPYNKKIRGARSSG